MMVDADSVATRRELAPSDHSAGASARRFPAALGPPSRAGEDLVVGCFFLSGASASPQTSDRAGREADRVILTMAGAGTA